MTETTPAPDLAELLRVWWPFVRKLARKYLRHACPFDRAADAEDLAAEIALRVVRRFRSYRPDRGSFTTWLAWVARSAANELRVKAVAKKRAAVAVGSTRRDGSDRFAELADPKAPAPAERLERAEAAAAHARQVARLRGTFAALTALQREAVKKRFGLGPAGRGHSLRGINPGRSAEANRQLVERGLEVLRERLTRAR
jgi:RNA polymerase sigma factor (sigma-70 family)